MTIEPSPEGPSFAERDTEPPTQGGIVDRLATRMSEREIAVALDLGHVAAFGVSASPARLSVAWAMVCQETARGKALWAFNFGNVDATADWHGERFSLTADEGYGASTRAQTKFLRAYPDAFSGAIGWWHFMAAHYAAALVAFDAGDGVSAARALKSKGYFTGDEAAYARALRLMAAEYLSKVKEGSL